MNKKEYRKPCFECLIVWNGEIRTTDVFDLSVDNDLSWGDILVDPTPSDNDNVIF